MSKNRLYLRNQSKNLRLHIFTDASKEVICTVMWLQDDATFKGLKESLLLNGPTWLLQKYDEKQLCSWCLVTEVEIEQATSTVATKTKLEQAFKWRWYINFNRVKRRAWIKMKQRGPPLPGEIHQAEQFFFFIFSNEISPNVRKSITGSREISKTLNITKLSPFIEGHRRALTESSTEAFEFWLQRQAPNIIDSKTYSFLTIGTKTQSTWEIFVNKSSGLLDREIHYKKSIQDISFADTGMSIQSTHPWWTYPEKC